MYVIILLILLLIMLLIVLYQTNNPELFNNYCKKPFKPTCNKDKIFSRIRYLEEKMDELEYDIFKLASKRTTKKYERQIELNNKAKVQAGKLRRESLRDLKKRQEDMDKLVRQSKLKTKLEEEERERLFKLNRKNKMQKTLNNIKKEGISIKLSGSGKNMDKLQSYMDETTNSLDVEEKKQMMGNIKNLNMPPGFVF